MRQGPGGAPEDPRCLDMATSGGGRTGHPTPVHHAAHEVNAEKKGKTQQQQQQSKRKSVVELFRGSYKVDDANWIATFAYGVAGKPKLLRYNLTKLIQYGGLATSGTKGTVFTMDSSVLRNAFVMAMVVGLVGTGTSLIAGPENVHLVETESLETLASNINGFVPFALALYVSLTLSRWWALRVDALGKVLEAVSNVMMLVTADLPGERWQGVRDQITKYAMASGTLLILAARGKPEVDKLREQGLLTNDEEAFLEEELLATTAPEEKLFQRSMVMWAWILRLVGEAYSAGKVPASRLGPVTAQCLQARNGIQTIHTYLQTQLPFAYVHLITFLVNIQNIVVSVKAGILIAIALFAKNDRGDPEPDYARIVNQLLMCVLICVVYQGLLAISYVVQDPFGEDLLDFPVTAYQEYVGNSVEALCQAQDFYPVIASRDGVLPTTEEEASPNAVGCPEALPLGCSPSRQGAAADFAVLAQSMDRLTTQLSIVSEQMTKQNLWQKAQNQHEQPGPSSDAMWQELRRMREALMETRQEQKLDAQLSTWRLEQGEGAKQVAAELSDGFRIMGQRIEQQISRQTRHQESAGFCGARMSPPEAVVQPDGGDRSRRGRRPREEECTPSPRDDPPPRPSTKQRGSSSLGPPRRGSSRACTYPGAISSTQSSKDSFDTKGSGSKRSANGGNKNYIPSGDDDAMMGA